MHKEDKNFFLINVNLGFAMNGFQPKKKKNLFIWMGQVFLENVTALKLINK